jgi:hypothetical protein
MNRPAACLPLCLLCVTFVSFVVNSSSVLAQRKKGGEKAETPKVVVALPLAVEAGKATKLTVRGLRIDTVTEVRLHEPKSSGKVLGKATKVSVPANTPPQLVGDSQIEIEITLPAEAAGGSVSFSLVNPAGEGPPHALVIADDTPKLAEKEPNDGFRNAQPLAFPQVVEGTVGRPQDVDVFRFEGRAGRRVAFELQAARYGSALDGILTLYDGQGRVVAVNDDPPFRGDPKLEVSLPAAGTYYLSLIDANDQGGTTHAYRLLAKSASDDR